jgi:universal stress protein A
LRGGGVEKCHRRIFAITDTPARFFPREETARAWERLSGSRQGNEPATAYRHILLATDFSAHSRRAVRRASEIAGRYGAKLSLLHVVEDLTLYDEFYDPIVPDRDRLLTQGLARARTRLDELARDLETIEGVEVRCAVLRGVPKSTIPGYARKQGADLVVVGSHGRSGARHLLGSVADAASHGAGCDVLTIRL